MSWIDRLAAFLVKRGYAGAKVGRSTADWRAPSTNADAEIAASGATLRYRARQLMRDNPYAKRAVGRLVSSIVGHGIGAQPNTTAKRARASIAAAWAAFERGCDFDGRSNLTGLVGVAVRAMIVDGEALVVMQRRPEGVKVRVIEADHLDTARFGPASMKDNPDGFIYEGVEYDRDHRRVAYWLFPDHPGGMTPYQRVALISVRTPASEVIHLFERERGEQNRGASWLSPCVTRLNHLDQYQEAELIRKRLEASFGAFVKQQEAPALNPVNGQPGSFVTDAKGFLIEQVRPGMISYLPPGAEVSFAQPTTNPSMEGHERSVLRGVAAGLGVPYEMVSGDLSQVNYSSMRAGRLEYQARVGEIQWQTVIPILCEGLWRWAMDDAAVKGTISETARNIPATWTPPRFPAVDPLKDGNATVALVRSGLMTWDDAVAEQGYDPEEQLQRIAENNKRFDALGLVLDCDPRYRQSKGAPIDSTPSDPTQADASPSSAAP